MATSATKYTTELRLATASGYTALTVLDTPVRDALPSEIPIIDVSSIFSGTVAARQTIARQIHAAASHSGFFYIKNHSISSKVVDEAYEACLEFFRQDTSTKKQTDANKADAFDNGYRAPDTQRINSSEGIDLRESYCISYDPRVDSTIADPATIPNHVSQYHAPRGHPWEKTAHLPAFKPALERYFRECLNLARAMTRLFALSLNLAEDFFDTKVQYPDANIGVNYYPPMPSAGGKVVSAGDSNERQSIGSHTDWQLFTILWQDHNGGLEVLSPEGQWIRAPPIEGTLVVNVADYMQRLTNDHYVSAVHRARNLSGRERISIPFFWGFGLHESCGVLESCLSEGEKKKYEEIKCADWMSLRVSYMLDRDRLQGNHAVHFNGTSNDKLHNRIEHCTVNDPDKRKSVEQHFLDWLPPYTTPDKLKLIKMILAFEDTK